MTILHDITSPSRGGAEHQLVGLVQLQVAAGHAVRIAYLKLEGYWRETLEQAGVGIVDLSARNNFNPAAARRLRREIDAFAPEVINAHMQPAELCARLALLADHYRTDRQWTDAVNFLHFPMWVMPPVEIPVIEY